MALSVLTRRVDSLEDLMAQLTQNVNRVSFNVDRLATEMREFKDEMREFKDEMRDFKNEMSEFKDETRESQRRNDAEQRAFRQSLAKISDKMGTLAEDMVAPSVPRILREIAGCSEEPQMLGVRIRKRLPDGRSREYDVIAVCDDYLLINETKSRLRPDDVPKFITMLQEARDFLPEYADKKIVGALATFYVDPSLIVHGERHGLIMLGIVDGLMAVLNEAGFHPSLY